MEDFTIQSIVKQLESCSYECEGGQLANNVAFIKFKKMGGRDYQTERYIGEELYTEEGIKVQVKVLSGEYQSRKGGYIVPIVCRDIYQNSEPVKFKTLITPKEQKEKEIAFALKTLKKHGYIKKSR